MTQNKFRLLLGLVASLIATTINAEPQPLNGAALEQAYLSHWFAYDSTQASEIVLTPLANDDIGERAELRFTSDDGQRVNGVIAFPASNTGASKLALALHPMGIDQRFWWSESSPLSGQLMTARLRQNGYTVISLDARHHGERGTEDFGPRELIARAHSAVPRVYIDTIIGSVRDYRIVLNWAQNEFEPDEVLAIGYSMGAQMSLLLASFEPSVSTVVAMVPPFVDSPTSPVAPRVHAPRVTEANVLWLAGTEDPHSKRDQTQMAFNQIASVNKRLVWFDAGHRLPLEFLDVVLPFFDELNDDALKNGERQQ